MEIIKNCVLLLKAEKSDDGEDKFEVMLLQNGFTVKHVKTLQFAFKSLDILRKKLENPNLYSAIIFTTPRTVKATKLALEDNSLAVQWQEKQTYVVGETTSNLVSSELNLNCKGQECGNASNLSTVIVEDKKELDKPILFPCGNLKGDILIKRLTDEDISIDVVCVYETIPNSSLREEFCEATNNLSKIPEFFVYFSPSGVHSTLEIIRQFNKELIPIKFVAIGPTTESALVSCNVGVFSVCLKPTPIDLLGAITCR